jgi:hypothetical protein
MSAEKKETLVDLLWEMAQTHIPEVLASDEYKKASAASGACLAKLWATLTEEQKALYLDVEEEHNRMTAIENNVLYKRIFGYGFCVGLGIGSDENDRGKFNEWIPILAKS